MRWLWERIRYRLLLWLADGRTVVLNAPFMMDPGYQKSGQWIIIANCAIYEGRATPDVMKNVEAWQREHPKAMQQMPRLEPGFEFRFPVGLVETETMQ